MKHDITDEIIELVLRSLLAATILNKLLLIIIKFYSNN